MDLANNSNKLVWTVKFTHDFPESVSTHCVKSLGEVDVNCLNETMLFYALFMELTGGKYHVDHTLIRTETTLALRDETLF